MEVSPRTPKHRRHPSKIDFVAPASGSHSNLSSPIRISHSRKSSLGSPMTPNGINALQPSYTVSSDLNAGDNGFGNLADELADAWDEDDDLVEQSITQDGERLDAVFEEMESSSRSPSSRPGSRHGPSGMSTGSPKRTDHRRKTSAFDSGGRGTEQDSDDAQIDAAIDLQLKTIDRLSRENPVAGGSISRMTDSLKELGSQAGMEGGASRLINAHSALSTNISNQTRAVQTLTFPLLSPFATYPPPEAINDLLPLLANTISFLPSSTSTALISMNELSTLTGDLIAHLSVLSDSLHMGRQTTTTAARKLKTVTDLVRDQRKEEEAKEEGIRWITRGEWDKRLRNRECGSACGDVVGGFEEVCQGWRRRLIEGLGAA